MLASRAGDALPAEELGRLVANRNVLAALLEAALAAAFLEWGFERVEPAVVAAFSEQIDYAATQHVDYKTELQETLARRRQQVVYVGRRCRGARHTTAASPARPMIDGVGGRQRLRPDEEGGRAGGRARGAGHPGGGELADSDQRGEIARDRELGTAGLRRAAGRRTARAPETFTCSPGSRPTLDR